MMPETILIDDDRDASVIEDELIQEESTDNRSTRQKGLATMR